MKHKRNNGSSPSLQTALSSNGYHTRSQKVPHGVIVELCKYGEGFRDYLVPYNCFKKEETQAHKYAMTKLNKKIRHIGLMAKNSLLFLIQQGISNQNNQSMVFKKFTIKINI